jgi:hypothetical protein
MVPVVLALRLLAAIAVYARTFAAPGNQCDRGSQRPERIRGRKIPLVLLKLHLRRELGVTPDSHYAMQHG